MEYGNQSKKSMLWKYVKNLTYFLSQSIHLKYLKFYMLTQKLTIIWNFWLPNPL